MRKAPSCSLVFLAKYHHFWWLKQPFIPCQSCDACVAGFAIYSRRLFVSLATVDFQLHWIVQIPADVSQVVWTWWSSISQAIPPRILRTRSQWWNHRERCRKQWLIGVAPAANWHKHRVTCGRAVCGRLLVTTGTEYPIQYVSCRHTPWSSNEPFDHHKLFSMFPRVPSPLKPTAVQLIPFHVSL